MTPKWALTPGKGVLHTVAARALSPDFSEALRGLLGVAEPLPLSARGMVRTGAEPLLESWGWSSVRGWIFVGHLELCWRWVCGHLLDRGAVGLCLEGWVSLQGGQTSLGEIVLCSCPEAWPPPLSISLVAQVVKDLPAMQETADLIPGLGRSPGEGNGYPLQYSCLGNPKDRGAWWATVCGVPKSQT